MIRLEKYRKKLMQLSIRDTQNDTIKKKVTVCPQRHNSPYTYTKPMSGAVINITQQHCNLHEFTKGITYLLILETIIANILLL